MAENLPGAQVSSDPNMPRIGQRVVERYEVVRHLGEGGFASVFEAIDTRASGHVAIKVLHTQKSFDESFAKRFRQEIMMCRQLQHPNSIKITDAGTTENGCLFMVMEFIAGKELIQVLADEAPLSHERVTHISAQILSALAEAHVKGIVHRDLKPANIMIGKIGAEEDYVKVLDFGIAKALVSNLQQVETQAGMVFCTPNYAAPEILLSKGVKPAADVYSLGLIMIEMLTGVSAWSADSQAAIIAAQLSPEPAPVPKVLDGTPLGIVITRAVAKNIEERYPNAGEMLKDLREAMHAARLSGSFLDPVGSSAGLGPHATQRLAAGANAPVDDEGGTSHTALLVVFALFVLCLCAAVVLFVLTQEEGTDTSGIVDAGIASEPETTVDAEPEIAPEPEPPPIWQGIVSRAYGGEPLVHEDVSATMAHLQQLDRSAQLNRLAVASIQRALLAQTFEQAVHEEAAEEYLQVIENVVQLLIELDLCDGAARRLENAFAAGSALIAPNATARINAVRGEIRACRNRLAETDLEWDDDDYEELAQQAQVLYEDAFAVEDASERNLVFFESLNARRHAANMLRWALDEGEIRERHVEGARLDLLHLLELVVHTQLELELRFSAEIQLEEMLADDVALPEEAVAQVQELQLLVAAENELSAEVLELENPFDPDGPWDLATYTELIELAEEAFHATRVPTEDTAVEEGTGNGE